jgi:hypothetical protein
MLVNTSIPSIPVAKESSNSGEWKEESRKRPVVLWVSVHETVRVVFNIGVSTPECTSRGATKRVAYKPFVAYFIHSLKSSSPDEFVI